MDTSYKFSYPCKTISNYYDNFYGVHRYDEIKAIAYRKREVNKIDKVLFEYFQLFQITYSLLNFSKCPICEFVKRENISEIMPALCSTDEIMFKLQHGKLYREHTLAKNQDE